MPSAEVGGDVRRNRALKLLAVGTIVDPFAGGRDPLASGSGCGMANHGYDVTIPLALARRVNRRVGAINPPATVRCHPPVHPYPMPREKPAPRTESTNWAAVLGLRSFP